MTKHTLRSNKVTLRPIVVGDLPHFVRWLNDPSVNKHLLHNGGLTLAKEREWFRKLQHDRYAYGFSIETPDKKLIGNLRLKVWPEHKRGQVGIVIGERAQQNKGYGTAALQLMQKFAFNQLRLHRLELLVYLQNAPAQAVYRKVGFKSEGIMVEYEHKRGQYMDTVLMGVLRREWLALQQQE